MEAKLKKVGEVSVVHLQGSLQIERAQVFRGVCEKHFGGKKVIFNMNEVSFVGSNGIQHFIDAMRFITGKSNGNLKLVGLRPEFKRIFANLEMQGLQIHESESEAMLSYTQPAPSLEEPILIPVVSDSTQN